MEQINGIDTTRVATQPGVCARYVPTAHRLMRVQVAQLVGVRFRVDVAAVAAAVAAAVSRRVRPWVSRRRVRPWVSRRDRQMVLAGIGKLVLAVALALALALACSRRLASALALALAFWAALWAALFAMAG